MLTHSQAAYQPIESHELGNSEDYFRRLQADLAAQGRRAKKLLLLSVTLGLLLLIVSALFVFIPPSELQCAKRLAPYSPLWDAIEFWEGDLINFFNHTSIYRGPPTYEREVAWNDLWHRPGIGVRQEGIVALNKTDAGQPVEVIGSDPAHPTYGAIAEVFHQLHCLNSIRQYTWPLDKFNKSWGMLYPQILQDPIAARMHVDHCIETIRLSLMCYADITPVLIFKDNERGFGINPDFNVHHKCRNFDQIVDYVETNGFEFQTTELGAEGAREMRH